VHLPAAAAALLPGPSVIVAFSGTSSSRSPSSTAASARTERSPSTPAPKRSSLGDTYAPDCFSHSRKAASAPAIEVAKVFADTDLSHWVVNCLAVRLLLRDTISSCFQ